MARRVLNLLVALSLLLFVAVAVGWVRQPKRSMCFSTGLPGHALLVISTEEQLHLALWRDWPAWEWPSVHQHVRYQDFDYCGPLFRITGKDGTSHRGYDLGL